MANNSSCLNDRRAGVCRDFNCQRHCMVVTSNSTNNNGRLYYRCAQHGFSHWYNLDDNIGATQHQSQEYGESSTMRNKVAVRRIEDPDGLLRKLVAINLVLFGVLLCCLILKIIS